MTDEPLVITLVEQAILRVREGKASMQTLLWTFSASTVFIPSSVEPKDGFFRPVFFQKDELQMYPAFTAPERVGNVASIAPWLVSFSGLELIRRIPAGDGLVVNPEAGLGFDVEPRGLASLRSELGIRLAPLKRGIFTGFSDSFGSICSTIFICS